MESKEIVVALGSLAQENRLAIFRLLVRGGDTGFAVGEIATRLGIPGATLSFHLKELIQAHLVKAQKTGRTIRCTVNFSVMRNVIAYLEEECCAEQASAPQKTVSPTTNKRKSL
jgi:ArsR family transcriptional regulator, arsenate/arsenite/antimonite-responsive transcriptional repressor